MKEARTLLRLRVDLPKSLDFLLSNAPPEPLEQLHRDVRSGCRLSRLSGDLEAVLRERPEPSDIVEHICELYRLLEII